MANPYAAQPYAALNQDPAWLAYLRASGFENAADQSDTTLQEAILRQNLGGNIDDINRSYDRAGEQLNTSYERRGIGGSGLEARDRGRLEADRGRAVGKARTGVEDTVSRLYSDLARRVASRGKQGAETALGLTYGS